MSDERGLALPTQDPFGRGPLVVTSLESPTTGVTITGRFSLGWLGRLTPEQIELVGVLLARRNNLQQLAADLGVSYNTIRSRFDEIVEAIGPVTPTAGDEAPTGGGAGRTRREILQRVAQGELTTEEASAELRRAKD